MAIEYSLVVTGATAPEQMWERLGVGEPAEVSKRGVWTADAHDFILTLHRATDGYFEDADIDWSSEPAEYLSVGFRMDKDADQHEANRRMLELVDRALESGGEDMALIQNHQRLLLERSGGALRRLPSDFWDHVEP